MRHWLLFGLGCALAVRLGLNVVNLKQAGEQVGQSQATVTKLEREQEELKSRLVEVQSPEFVEREAREKLGLGKPGETVVVLPEQPEIKRLSDEEIKAVPNWKRWWEEYINGAE